MGELVMKNNILELLKSIEKQYDISVLYTCESGSRAWGFPSTDSDFDVRFIYAHRPQWYLTLNEKKDTITENFPNDLDVSGWDIRKALNHFAKSNATIYEWLDSPIVYLNSNGFAERLRNLVPDFFNPIKAFYHYSESGKKILEQERTDDSISVKKLMYVLRSFLACEWIFQKSSMPPTLFKNIYEQIAVCS